jgi:hypothetical protein
VTEGAEFPVEPWCLRECGLNLDLLGRSESLFALSNDSDLRVHQQSVGFTRLPPWDFEASRDKYPLLLHARTSTCTAVK